MKNKDNLAYEYALGLLTREQKKAIKITPEFAAELAYWGLQLVKLHDLAPLNSVSSKRIWKNISKNIKSKKTNWMAKFYKNFKLWNYALPFVFLIFSAFLVSPYIFDNITPDTKIITSAKVGWDIKINTADNKLFIKPTNPMPTAENETCTLWVRKNGKVYFISYLPDLDSKIVNLEPNMVKLFENSEIIISIEAKEKPINKPTKIEYIDKLS